MTRSIPFFLLTTLASTLPLLGCGEDDPGRTCEACGDADGGRDAGPFDAGALDASSGTDAGATADAGCVPLEPCGLDPVVVDPAWLEARLGEADLVALDTRSAAAYGAGHVPGARLVDPDALRATVDGVPGQVAPAADVEAELRRAGVEHGARLVVYGDSTTTTPARVFWTLEHYGHDAAVLFLDGGFGRWSAEGKPSETGPAPAASSSYVVTGPVDGTRVDAAWVLAALDDPAVTLVDARSDAEHASGHIPGAVSVDWTRNVEAGSFQSIDELRPLYESFAADGTLVTYCQTGSRAAVSYVVLRWLGYPDVRLYDGSWAEWGSRSDLPREP